MYERMLDKQCQPTFDKLAEYCGECRNLFRQMNDFLVQETGASGLIRFPYGNSYGWSLKYSIKSTHICDLFAEKDAFTVMLRLTNDQFAKGYYELSDYAKAYIDKKYPCGDGGWIHYRVLTAQHMQEIMELLLLKTRPCRKTVS